jgi:hypothetical protein
MRMETIWTEEEFETGARCLSRVLERIEIDERCCLLRWSLETSSNGSSYLTHAPVKLSATFQREKEVLRGEEECFVDNSLIEDPDSDVLRPMDEAHLDWRVSIVYSETWRVPVVYFTVLHPDGSPCTREDIVDSLMDQNHQNQINDSWDFISHDEHPITGVPSLFLHPCRT